MATKDFKVKNGLRVGENIIIDSGNIVIGTKEVISVTGSITGQYEGFDSDFSISISNTSTDSLSEGLNNLYYTTARADSAFDVRLATKTTDDLTEGASLYYTQSRFDSALALKTTDDLTEGASLYYTTARADSAFDVRLSTKTTDDLTEGANLYFTDSRVQSYLSNNSYATISNIDSAIAALVAAAPDQLDTLNELAAAINNDSDFSGTVISLIGEKLAKSEFTTYFDSNFNIKTTDDLTEGSNLYYTQSRFDSALALKTTDDLVEGNNNLYYTTARADSAFDVRLSTKTTDDLTEGANLYYTKLRVDSDIINLIDSSYIQSKQITYDFLDSSEVISLIDSDYIEARRPAESIFQVTSSGASAYVFNGDGFPSASNNPSLYLQRGSTYKFKVDATGHPFQIRLSNGGSAYSDGVINNSAEVGDILFTVPMNAPDTLYYQCTVHSSMGGTIYVTEAASINTDVISEGTTNLYYTDARVTALVDSAYVQARQVDIYRDSAFVTGIVDATYINSLVNATDSAAVINIVTDTIDSAYINARVVIPEEGIDSAQTISLITETIDSAYIQARQLIGGGSGTVDSAQTIALITDTIDSDYITSRISVSATTFVVGEHYFKDFKFIADSGQTIFSGADENGNTLSFDSDDFQIYINGIRIADIDYTANPQTNTITLTTPAGLEDEVIITSLNIRAGEGGGGGTVDSAQTIALITETVDSAYINARVTIPQAYGDSDVQLLIDSDYIVQRVNTAFAGTGKIHTYLFTADSGQLTFSGADDNGRTLVYGDETVEVYLNGVLLVQGLDYTATNGTSIDLTEAADSSDQILVKNISTLFSAISGFVYPKFVNYVYYSDSGQTQFSGADENGNILSLEASNYQVFINGIRLLDSDISVNPTTDTLTIGFPLLEGDEVSINTIGGIVQAVAYESIVDSAYINARVTIPQAYGDNDVLLLVDSAYINARVTIPQAYGDNDVLLLVDSEYIQARQLIGGAIDSAQTIALITDTIDSDYILDRAKQLNNGISTIGFYRYISSSGQTVFSGTDINGNLLQYEPGNVLVYYNGALLAEQTDFTANNGSSINLTVAADSSDDVFVVNYAQTFYGGGAAPSLLLDHYYYVADSGQVTFTGADETGAVLNYKPGNILVFLNGFILRDSTDYQAINGTSVVLTEAAQDLDELRITKVVQSTFGNNFWREASSNYTIASGQKLIVDTSTSAVTITLPSIAGFGDEIRIIDGSGNAATNNITINRNGHKIQGNETNFIIDVNEAAFGLVYYNVSRGWILTEK
jgi:hypothetical protein